MTPRNAVSPRPEFAQLSSRYVHLRRAWIESGGVAWLRWAAGDEALRLLPVLVLVAGGLSGAEVKTRTLKALSGIGPEAYPRAISQLIAAGLISLVPPKHSHTLSFKWSAKARECVIARSGESGGYIDGHVFTDAWARLSADAAAVLIVAAGEASTRVLKSLEDFDEAFGYSAPESIWFWGDEMTEEMGFQSEYAAYRRIGCLPAAEISARAGVRSSRLSQAISELRAGPEWTGGWHIGDVATLPDESNVVWFQMVRTMGEEEGEGLN